MGWPTKYKGPEIDTALEKGRNLRVVNNGWIRLDSNDTTPVNLGDLKNPGNYTMAYYTDGPLGVTGYSPINISIFKYNDIIYQCGTFGEKTYIRQIDSGSSVYGKWTQSQTSGTINPGPNPPPNPVEGGSIWFDTTNPDNPTLKVYVDGSWKEVVPEGAMVKEVYDTQNKNTDIFAYIDQAIADASLGEVGIDFDTHIKDSTIHVTADEKAKWNNGATQDDIDTASDQLVIEMQQKITSEVNNNVGILNQLDQDINTVSSNLTAHTENSTIHPSLEKQQSWDAKAEADHTHNQDGSVTVDAEHVIGPFSSDAMPYDVKERVIIVNSDEERLQLQKNPAHNGDAVCVSDPVKGDSWYFIVNDSKMGTEEAFKKIASSGGSIQWSSITDTPTTIEGYGITDAASDSDIVELKEQISTAAEKIPAATDITNLTEIQRKYDEALDTITQIDAAFGQINIILDKLEAIAN